MIHEWDGYFRDFVISVGAGDGYRYLLDELVRMESAVQLLEMESDVVACRRDRRIKAHFVWKPLSFRSNDRVLF